MRASGPVPGSGGLLDPSSGQLPITDRDGRDGLKNLDEVGRYLALAAL
jgi:hypothetical protein